MLHTSTYIEQETKSKYKKMGLEWKAASSSTCFQLYHLLPKPNIYIKGEEKLQAGERKIAPV